jgi:MOSC domain-containing protein YiiM
MPCAKLALRFNRSDMVKLFWKSSRSGIYFSVEKLGELGAGDQVQVLEIHPLKVSINDVLRLYKGETSDPELYQRFIASPLAGSWKEHIRERWTTAQSL